MKKLLFGFLLVSMLLLGCVNNTSYGNHQTTYQEKGITTTTTTTLPTHLTCGLNSGNDQLGACVRVQGAGRSNCFKESPDSSDCYHLGCDPLSTCSKVAGSGTNDPQCSKAGQDCLTGSVHHFQCIGASCTWVSGSGANSCDPRSLNNDCAHNECVIQPNGSYECERVSGPGNRECDFDRSNNICDYFGPVHYECVQSTCTRKRGGGTSDCTSNADCFHVYCKKDSNGKNECVEEAGKGDIECALGKPCTPVAIG